MNNGAYQTILACRSIRHFTDTPISEDAVTRILQAGRWAGSAKNTQPWQFVVVREREALHQLAACGYYASHLRGAAAAVVLVTSSGRWADFDAGRAAQNMMLAAWTMGIGSCIASLHDEAQASIAISFGYPLKDAPQEIEGRPREEVLATVGRRPLEKLVHWETW